MAFDMDKKFKAGQTRAALKHLSSATAKVMMADCILKRNVLSQHQCIIKVGQTRAAFKRLTSANARQSVAVLHLWVQ